MKGHNPLFNGMHGKVSNFIVTHAGGEAIIRERTFRVPTRSQAQVQTQIQFKSSSQSFKMLGEDGMESYRELGARMLSKSGKPLSGANAYSSITSTRALMGLPPLPTAPEMPLLSPALPSALFLSAVNDGGAFHVSLNVPAPVTGLFLLECAAWVSAGVAYFSPSLFRVCAVLDGLETQTDITPDFTDRFAQAPAGTQVVVRLTPLTETGFRGASALYPAFVAASAEAMAADLDKRRARKNTLRLREAA